MSHHLRKGYLFNAVYKTFTDIVKLLLHLQKWGNWWNYILKLGNRLWRIVLILRSKAQATEESEVSQVLSLCEEEKFMVADSWGFF